MNTSKRKGKELWTDSDVLCPFYISADKETRSVSCEGYSEGSTVVSRFRSIAQREKHMGCYCVGRYERCPMYQCTYKAKYDD